MDCREEGNFNRHRGKQAGRRMKGSLCMPRPKRRSVSPLSLWDRLREVLLRLIMLSAISKCSETRVCPGDAARHSPTDSHYREAIADCIEFFKKSAASPKMETTSGHKNDGGDEDDFLVELQVL